ncbi:MAG: 1-acyl-sn-glycerol-3-phosphate acyltransferase [Bacteroidales bacterium]|nr:1-acyl-sn-glycerol-3-phosphate acyltransferase [Bacteroidales bacterium]
MTGIFLRIYDFLEKRRGLTIALALTLTAVFAFLASRVRYEEDISKFLPRDGKSRKYQEVYQQFAAQNRVAVVFSATHDSIDVETLQTAMQRYGDLLSESDMVENLSVTVDETQIFDLMDAVYAHLPYLLEDEDYARVDSLLQTPGFIQERLAQDKQLLMFPVAGTVMHTLPVDPLQLFTPCLQRLNSLKLNDAFQIVGGYLFTADGKHGIVTFDSPFGANESFNNGKLSKYLENKALEVQQEVPEVEIVAVGAPLIAATNAARIKKDSITAVAIAIVLILLILLLHYRRLSDILWVGGSILFGALFALAGVFVFRGGISIIVLGIGSVIIGIVANYPLHFLDEYKEVGDRREALREMVLPLFIGNLTTVAAFFCLLWLDARAMQDLGLFASLMLLGTILFVLVFLPQFMRRRPSPSEHLLFEKWTGHHLSRSKARPWILCIGLIITIILGYFSQKISFDSDLSHINYMTKSQRDNLEILSQVQSSDRMYAAVEGRTLQEAVNRNDSLVTILKSNPAVTAVSGVGEMLPSQKRQCRAADRWNTFWQQESRRQFLADFLREANALGFSENAFQPFVNLLSEKWESSDIEEFNDIVEPFTSKYIFPYENGYRIVNYVQTDNQAAVHEVVDDGDDAAFVFSGNDVGNQLVNMLRGSFNYIGWVCGLVVFVFLLISFRRIELALMAFLPLAVSWIWILGFMHLTGIQFNIVNIILATFIFGQGDDYTIFITEGLLYEYTTGKPRLASYKHSVVISALIMFAGIGCLIVAKHPALRSLALVTIIGMVTVVMMASFLPPVIFDLLTKKNGKLRETPVTLRRLVYTLFIGVCFLLLFFFLIPYTAVYFALGKNTEDKKLRYHTMLHKMAVFYIHHLPFIRFRMNNAVGETFEKPAVIVANHQSHFDLVCMMAVTPKIVFLTNDWVWRNPFYGLVIRKAEYYPVSDGMEQNLPRLRDLYARGYSICVFPEGTRSPNCEILRFHKGAFTLARELDADILPIFLHGTGHVLPKEELMFRRGEMYLEVGERVRPFEEVSADADSERDRLVTKQMRHYYQEQYAALCAKIETPEYWRFIRKYQEYYKLPTAKSQPQKANSQ